MTVPKLAETLKERLKARRSRTRNVSVMVKEIPELPRLFRRQGSPGPGGSIRSRAGNAAAPGAHARRRHRRRRRPCPGRLCHPRLSRKIPGRPPPPSSRTAILSKKPQARDRGIRFVVPEIRHRHQSPGRFSERRIYLLGKGRQNPGRLTVSRAMCRCSHAALPSRAGASPRGADMARGRSVNGAVTKKIPVGPLAAHPEGRRQPKIS